MGPILLLSFNINFQKKQTPLHLAASAGKQAACDMLIGLGAGVDSTDDYGQKPVRSDFCIYWSFSLKLS